MRTNRLLRRGITPLLFLAAFSNLYALNFTLLTDIHVSPGNENEKQLKAAIEEINNNDSPFVILSGDLSNEGSDEELYNVKSILDNLHKPIYVIPGNHENNWSQSATKTFNDIWGNDRFVFETDSLIFIGINCGPYMKMGDGHIKQEDLSWLDSELQKRESTGKRVVSINHYPIQDDLDNYQEYISILQKYPTIIHICGHYHTYKTYEGGDIDAVICRALDMNKANDGYGYSEFSIDNDSIHIYDKVIGQTKKIQFSLGIKDKHPKYEFNYPENNEIPQDFSIKKIYQDEASIFTRLAVDKSGIYFGNSLGAVKAINMDGQQIWKLQTNASLFSRPAIANANIIIPTSDKRMIWADKKTGDILGESSSDGPYVADGIVSKGSLYQGGYKKFECWDINAKQLKWRADLGNYCQAEPTVEGKDIIFGAWDTYLRCIDKRTGNIEWSWSNGRNVNLLSPGDCIPVVTKERVIIVAPDRYMTVLDRKTGKVIWRSNFDQKYKVRESLGCSEDKKLVYAKTMDGQLIAVDPNKDEANVKFVVDAGFGYEHAPCCIIEDKGVIYMGSRRGIIAAIDRATEKLLWTYRCGSSEVNGFEKFNGKIYVSLTEGSIWEITKK